MFKMLTEREIIIRLVSTMIFIPISAVFGINMYSMISEKNQIDNIRCNHIWEYSLTSAIISFWNMGISIFSMMRMVPIDKKFLSCSLSISFIPIIWGFISYRGIILQECRNGLLWLSLIVSSCVYLSLYVILLLLVCIVLCFRRSVSVSSENVEIVFVE